LLHILVVAGNDPGIDRLCTELGKKGLRCTIVPPAEGAAGQIGEKSPDVTLLHMNGNVPPHELLRRKRKSPVIVLVDKANLGSTAIDFNTVDDFIVLPANSDELLLRVQRLLGRMEDEKSGEVTRCGDLAINLATCEVTLSGRLIDLTFKEYELLRFLASHPGRVYTRDSLLNEVWGYDYFGGDRTVDVHIRRLRSKVEDLDHSFIETVRNVGYRFRCPS
jgi:DNA-binding response OmpR family regulator